MTGKSKGYGFMTFKYLDGALNALKNPGKIIEGHMTITRLASSQPGAIDVCDHKIFIGNSVTPFLSPGNGVKVGEIEVHAQLLPEDKLRFIGELKQEGMIAMVGDGINDALILAATDVGITMGVEGSVVDMESADVVLMSNDIRKIAGAVKIGWRSMRTMHSPY